MPTPPKNSSYQTFWVVSSLLLMNCFWKNLFSSDRDKMKTALPCTEAVWVCNSSHVSTAAHQIKSEKGEKKSERYCKYHCLQVAPDTSSQICDTVWMRPSVKAKTHPLVPHGCVFAALKRLFLTNRTRKCVKNCSVYNFLFYRTSKGPVALLWFSSPLTLLWKEPTNTTKLKASIMSNQHIILHSRW